MAALPDTTDMLSIVLGAGLSLDQAIARVGEEIRFVYPELADEFYWMTLEVQAGQERSVAFQHMAQRTGLLDIRSLASMIVQAERFGTGLSQALRIYADSVRTKRRLEIEATINKAGVKMVFPIVKNHFYAGLIDRGFNFQPALRAHRDGVNAQCLR